ncbi:hsp90 co-chaperone aha1 [Pyrenophora tritici-repentis]|nr:hsp90 co-chaperone aha1 [Pyrenophora tritici-repentis]
MVLHNPNNWHWVNKDVSGWTREYLDKELTQISAEQDGVTAKIDKVVSMDGDVDVSQRKGKVITIFDVRLKLEYSGKNKEGEEASGTITVPEVAHDTEEDEYVVCSLRSHPLSFSTLFSGWFLTICSLR